MSGQQQLDGIESGLNHLLEGEFHKIGDGSCPYTTLIKKIADKNAEFIERNLRRTVDMSITASKSVTGGGNHCQNECGQRDKSQ